MIAEKNLYSFCNKKTASYEQLWYTYCNHNTYSSSSGFDKKWTGDEATVLILYDLENNL